MIFKKFLFHIKKTIMFNVDPSSWSISGLIGSARALVLPNFNDLRIHFFLANINNECVVQPCVYLKIYFLTSTVFIWQLPSVSTFNLALV